MTCEIVVEKDLLNGMGTLHGGSIAMFFDEILGMTCFTMSSEDFYPNVTLNVDYFNSTKIGDIVKLESKVLKFGRKLMHNKGNLISEDNKIIASASASYINSGKKLTLLKKQL